MLSKKKQKISIKNAINATNNPIFWKIVYLNLLFCTNFEFQSHPNLEIQNDPSFKFRVKIDADSIGRDICEGIARLEPNFNFSEYWNAFSEKEKEAIIGAKKEFNKSRSCVLDYDIVDITQDIENDICEAFTSFK